MFWNITSELSFKVGRNFVRKMPKICYLKSVDNPDKIISLAHGKSVFIGRNEETGITDINVSRNHLECIADTSSGTMKLKTIGQTYSGANGYALVKNATYSLKHGDRIEVRLGHHPFEVHFDSTSDDEPPEKRSKLDLSVNNTDSGTSFNNRGSWEEIDGKDLLIYTSENCLARDLIAGFDLDGTIIKTKSGARFPKDAQDWVFNFSEVPDKLRKLYDKKYKIVIFTNQLGLENNAGKIKDFKTKIEAIILKLAIPMQVLVATTKSIYRKPAPGMWNVLSNVKQIGTSIDLSKSYYIGDAAGRAKNWAPKKNKDHSVADRLFALNIGVKFFTPEEYFLNAPSVPYTMPEFDPRTLTFGDYPDFTLSDVKKEVIVMVGGQGSGKTFFCKVKLIPEGYVHISRDKLGSWQKCVKALEEHLQKDNAKVVIDNTNPDKESRQRYIEVAKKYNTNIRCFVMDTSYEHYKHNNKFRELTDKTHTTVGDIVINSYRKSFQEPVMAEGFTEIVKVPFVPKFDGEDQEKLYRMFLLEK